MATKSGALALTTTNANVAVCGAGAEVVAFGLVFANTTAATRTVTLRVYQAALGTPVDIPFTVAANANYSWPKPIALQPGDYVAAKADATGVTVLWSVDEDTGATPVATGFNPRGAYAAGSTYAVNDVVAEGGASYISRVNNNTGNTPSTSPAQWMLNSAQGTQGPAGTSLTKGTGADIRTGTDDAKYLTAESLYDASAGVTLTYAATVAVDLAAGLNFTLTLTGNATLGAPTNVKPGSSGVIVVKQDAAGSRTLAYNTAWKFAGGVPSLSTAANAVDVISYYADSTGTLYCTLSKAFA
ncbi:hypothetical protein [Caulobacter vibrioides]|uniref:Tail fiber protein n=1 Tax=Caulobacter phage S2B TaxID=2759120 RepID=A0AAE7ML43_9CAUD|nr:hypothetical protein [Caulobacter vibrioides]QOC54124.1 tail fiber protein [Caulobacter phage S2B]QXZ50197.1 hypothetical protein KZH45_09700 [Caulobacter vibrioides]